MKYHVLFNPHAGNGTGEASSHKLDVLLKNDSLRYYNMTEISSYAELFAEIPNDETIILAGGDGTLNRFVNDIDGLEIAQDIQYFAAGSGNDFLHDLGLQKGAAPLSIKKYLMHLPRVTVNGRTLRFLNGIGYGIDGYCCEVGDQKRETSNKPVNYTVIAILGLLFHYKPVNARITVDGKTSKFSRVWLAPTMNGRFYGGGMMVTPAQDRTNEAHTVSVGVLHGAGKLKTLIAFPGIFKGKHVERTEMFTTLTGHEITVEFDRPCALQIDGETVRNVTEYSVSASLPTRV